jgi:spermidine synthase
MIEMSVAFLSSKFTNELPQTIFAIEEGDLTIEVRENSQYRWLTFDNGVIQSAMSLREPNRLVLPYTGVMLAPLIFNSTPLQATLLGIGGGGLIRYLRHYLPDMHLHAVDLSPAVVETAKSHFSLPALDSHFEITIVDAREVIARASNQDLMMLDVFDQQGMPPWLGSDEVLRACRGALSENGVLSINVMVEDETALATMVATVRHVFLGRVLVATVPGYRNIIVFAFRSAIADTKVSRLGKHATSLERQFDIPLGRIFRNICGANACRGGHLIV